MYKIRMTDMYNKREINASLVRLKEGKWECQVETKNGIKKIVEFSMNDGFTSEKYINRGFFYLMGYQERNPDVDIWIDKNNVIHFVPKPLHQILPCCFLLPKSYR